MRVFDAEMAYIDVGQQNGAPICVFLHGNPTSSFLWRNIVPTVQKAGTRCVAVDLIGMGNSSKKEPGFMYTFEDHARYLDEWFAQMDFKEQIFIVIHDWGSALGFNYAYRYPEKIRGIIFMEAVFPMESWDQFDQGGRRVFQGFRSTAGEKMILEKNLFVERVLPSSILRQITEEELQTYVSPFKNKGEDRRPTLTWPREIPIQGEPKHMWALCGAYTQWLKQSSNVPKLFINANPGSILIGKTRDMVRKFPNQTEVTVKGSHFIQEDSPDEIAAAIILFLEKNCGNSKL